MLTTAVPICRSSAARVCCFLSAAILPGGGFADLGKNYVFMAGFWGWFLAQTCKVKAAQAQLLLLNTCFGTHAMCEAADLYKKMAQGGVGPESYCRFWWHAVLTFSSMLGATLR